MVIIAFNKQKYKINKIKYENSILNINDYYKLGWYKLIHNIIHNSINLPKYYKNIIELINNRNGLLIKTNYRKSKYGDWISYNKMEELWNSLKKEERDIQNRDLFLYTIIYNNNKNTNNYTAA